MADISSKAHIFSNSNYSFLRKRLNILEQALNVENHLKELQSLRSQHQPLEETTKAQTSEVPIETNLVEAHPKEALVEPSLQEPKTVPPTRQTPLLGDCNSATLDQKVKSTVLAAPSNCAYLQ